ncbi:MAG TPA: hypothetical protein VF795_02265 [Desulfuromonadaceae bacterium]
MTTIPQLSPTALIGPAGQLNPLTHSTYNQSAAMAGTMVQKKTAREKSDSVTISRQALEKAALGEDGKPKETRTKEAPDKAKAK